MPVMLKLKDVELNVIHNGEPLLLEDVSDQACASGRQVHVAGC